MALVVSLRRGRGKRSLLPSTSPTAEGAGRRRPVFPAGEPRRGLTPRDGRDGSQAGLGGKCATRLGRGPGRNIARAEAREV